MLMGVMAFTLVLAGTEPPGPGIDPDAVSYLGAAESLVHTGSFRIPTAEWASPDSTEPLAHFPPGYSAVLAIPIAAGMQPVQAARLVEAIAAFSTTTLLVLLVESATNVITALLLVLALFAMTAMHEVHISVLSEPLYLVYMLLALTAMVRWPDRPLRAGIPAALAVMTRYAGASLVAGVALWTALRPGTWRQRMTRVAVSVAPAVLLQLIWVLRTERAHDAEEIRRFAFYGNLAPTLHQGLATVIAWLVPDPTVAHDLEHRGWAALAVGIGLIAIVERGHTWLRWSINSARAVPSSPDGDGSIAQAGNMVVRSKAFALRLIHACALLIVCYLGVIVASRLFADPLIPFDERLLSPALVLTMIVLAMTIGIWWRRTHLAVARIIVAVAFAAWWLVAAMATHNESRYALEWGSDFAGHDWRTSELIAWARVHAAHTQLYTNWPAAAYFHLHRNSHELPRRVDEKTLAAFGDSIRVRHGVVLLFGVGNGEYIPNDSLFNVPGLEMVAELRDGVIMAHKP